MYGIFVDQRCRGAHKKQEAQRCQNCVVCFKSSSLKPLGQLEPNLAGMCILDCPLERLCFCLLIRDTQNKQEAHRSQKWSCHHCRLSLLLSLSFCILFFFFGTKLVELFIGWSFKKWSFLGFFFVDQRYNFYCRACNKPGKWAVMYCIGPIFGSLYKHCKGHPLCTKKHKGP